MEKVYDLGIIGSGPAGYTSALSARGQKVVIFEEKDFGGTCLNRGCIPTKAILHSAEIYNTLKSANNSGFYLENVNYDWEKILEIKNEKVLKLRKILETSVKNSGAEIIYSRAKIIGNGKIQDGEGNIYFCKKIISATGSKPKEIKGLEFDGDKILSSDDILNLKKCPKSILIVGSGAIGIEWGRILSTFDCEVTIVEMAEHLLPLADVEVSKRVERIFKSKGIKFYLSNSIKHLEKTDLGVNVELKTGEKLNVEKILVAAGRQIVNLPETFDAKVIGDASGEIQLAHYATRQALYEISNINFDKSLIPSVVYGTPEIAWAGKREQDLEIGSFKKITLPISALGKSQCDNTTDGFIKIITVEDKIIGVHIISNEASSLVQQVLTAIQNGITIDKLKEVCFPHPTYSEGIFEAIMRL